ncbi:MAG: glycosyltransferase [Bacteroidetes bacterium]|nr:glycosyltransferase [Bacteroidota bacterium]
MAKDDKNLWTFREAKKVSPMARFLLIVLVIAGFISVIRLANWWFREEHVANLGLFILLSAVFWYGILRLLLIWTNYLAVKKPEPMPTPAGLRVAIFTTSSPGEPLSMFEKTLEACANITYPHTTYLLDDTQNPEFKACAERHGAVWLELVGLPGAKAGKVNKALSLTTEEFVLVLDPDHIPFPNFLDEVLGFFNDEKVGYVQVAQAYYNQYRSFTAKGAAQQTYGFYGPTQMGLFGRNCAVAIGANCTFRRKALESAGGHGIGLAEDLITAIRIHAEGWKSIYHPVIVSRGLVPEDFGSFCKQQLKWARGVHEVLFAEVPRLFKKLSFWQRISYSTIGTYYLVGTTTLIYMLIPFLYLLFGVLPANMRFIEFIEFGIPVTLISILIYLYVQIWMCHPKVERGLHWNGIILKFATWPVFFLGFLLSLVDGEIPYIPTAKQAVTGKVSPFARPLLAHILLFVITVFYTLYQRRYIVAETTLVKTAEQTWGMIAFASISVLLAFGGMYAVIESKRLSAEDPWEKIDVSKLESKRKES